MDKQPRRQTLNPLPPETSYSSYQVASSVLSLLRLLQPGLSQALVIGLDPPLPPKAARGSRITSLAASPGQWGSGELIRLPYERAQFNCVVACDVIDQLPEGARGLLVDEMARVSSQYIVLVSPFDSRVVARAEESVNDVHRSIFQDTHPRLSAHARAGLPTMSKVRDLVTLAMGREPEVFPGTSLRSWTLFEMLECVARAGDYGATLLDRVTVFYNTRYAALDHELPAYRHIVVAARDRHALTAQVVENIRRRFSESDVQPEIQAVRSLLRLALDAYAEALASPTHRGGAAIAALRRAEDLERKVRVQARAIDRLHDEIYALKGAGRSVRPGRLIRKLFNS